MYLLNWLAFLPWLLPWSNACLSLNSALLSSQLKNPYSFLPSQLLVTLAGPSPATFATDNTTKSMPPVEKKQDPDTEKTKPENAQLQDTSPCPEQEDLDCDECGGQKYDKEEGTFRCVGAEEDRFKWIACFCCATGKEGRNPAPYKPQGGTPEEIAEDFRSLPLWTNKSWSRRESDQSA